MHIFYIVLCHDYSLFDCNYFLIKLIIILLRERWRCVRALYSLSLFWAPSSITAGERAADLSLLSNLVVHLSLAPAVSTFVDLYKFPFLNTRAGKAKD